VYIKLKINLKQIEKCVGWAGVRSVLSTHCSATLHSKIGDQLIVNAKIIYVRKRTKSLLIGIIVNKDLTMAFS
jgi:hypothetical protein